MAGLVKVEGFSRDGTPSPGAQAWWDKTKLTLSQTAAASNAQQALDTANQAMSKVSAAVTSQDSSVAQSLASGSATKGALTQAVSQLGYVSGTGLDAATAQNVNTAGSQTRSAISTLIAGQIPAAAASGSNGGGGSGPRFYVESYRSAGMSDDATIRACIKAAAAVGTTFEHPIVEFGPGPYSVNAGIFSDIARNVQAGMTFQGQGYTTLRLITGGKADQWFYDNGASTDANGNDAGDHRRLAFAKWVGFNFTTDDPTRTNGNGFRFTGALMGHEQNFVFDHCRFNSLNVCFDTEGTMNTDSIRLYACYGYDNNTVMVLNNTQALLMEWFGTAFELIRKDAFVVKNGGGGDVKIFGGSWVMQKASGDTAGPYALLNVAASDNVGPGNGNFAFLGARTELRDTDTMYANLPGPQGTVFALFDACNLYVTGSGVAPHQMVNQGDNRRVTFRNCVISPNAQFVFSTSWSSQVMAASTLEFYSCEVPTDLAATISWTAYNKFGTARARGCRPLGGVSATWTSKTALDFDMNRLQGAFQPGALERKIMPLLPTNNMPWPSQNTSSQADWQVVLPPGAIISRIVLYRPATGSSSTAYQLAIGNGDKSITYATTYSSGTFSQAGNIDMNPTTLVGSDMTSRTVRLWATKPGDKTDVFGGYAYIEYL